MRSMLVAFILMIAAAPAASALTRDDIIATALAYTTQRWTLDANDNGTFEASDTTISLHDYSNKRRYWKAGGTKRSPIADWIIGQCNGNFLVTHAGAPYAFGARHAPDELDGWLGIPGPGLLGHCNQPVGLSKEQWNVLHGQTSTANTWAGLSDCSGMAGKATDWAGWKTLGTAAMLEDVGPRGHYKMRCRMSDDDCNNQAWDDWQIPAKGDLLVKKDHHVMVFVSLTLTTTSVIECAGSELQHCLENTKDQSYEDYLSAGWRALSVRGLVDDPRTQFLSVSAEAVPGGVHVAWSTSFLENTWGFAVQHSPDGVSWQAAGNYVLPERATTDGVERFSETVDVPTSGFVRVVEIEKGSQRVTFSPPVRSQAAQ